VITKKIGVLMSCEMIKKTWEFAWSHVTQCQFEVSMGSCVCVCVCMMAEDGFSLCWRTSLVHKL